MGRKGSSTSVPAKRARNNARRESTSIAHVPNRIDPDLLAHFGNPILREEFITKYQQRHVTGERCFDVAFLRKIEFPFLDDFHSWGWMKLLTKEMKIYPNLVQIFYFNGDLYRDDEEREIVERGIHLLPHAVFYTSFNGERIQITVKQSRMF